MMKSETTIYLALSLLVLAAFPAAAGSRKGGTLASDVSAGAQAPNRFKSVILMGPHGKVPLAKTLQKGTTNYSFHVTGLRPGKYTLTAIDKLGQKTSVSWFVDSLDVNLSSGSRATLSPEGDRFLGHIALQFEGTQELFSLEQVENGSLIDNLRLQGFKQEVVYQVSASTGRAPAATILLISPTGTSIPAGRAAPAYQFIVRDDTGNSVEIRLEVRLTNDTWTGGLGKPYPWKPKPAAGRGKDRRSSPVYDLFETGPREQARYGKNAITLSGAVMQPGTALDFGLSVRANPERLVKCDPGAGAYPIGHAAVDVCTGDAPKRLKTCRRLLDSDIDLDRGVTAMDAAPGSIELKRYFQLAYALSRQTPAAIPTRLCKPGTKDQVRPGYCLAPEFVPEFSQLGPPVRGLAVALSTRIPLGVIIPQGAQSLNIPLGIGYVASGLRVKKYGSFMLEQRGAYAERGFVGLPKGSSVHISTSQPILAPFRLSADYDPKGMSEHRQSFIRVIRASSDGKRSRLPSRVEPKASVVTFQADPSLASSHDGFYLAVPDFQDPAITEVGDLRVVSDRPGVTASVVGGEKAMPAMQQFYMQGLIPVGQAFMLSASTSALNPPGVLRFSYQPKALARRGLDGNAVSVMGFDSGGLAQYPLDAQMFDTVNAEITASLGQIPQYVGLFAMSLSGPPSPPEQEPPASLPPGLRTESDGRVSGDMLPPRTSLFPIASDLSALLCATERTSFRLSRSDDFAVMYDSAGAGVSAGQTFVAIDTSPFHVYKGAFSLHGEGFHSIYYYSNDRAGNQEAANTAIVALDLTPPITTLKSSSTGSGRGIAMAAGEKLTLSAMDPIQDGVTSGVEAVYYAVDRAPSCGRRSKGGGSCTYKIYQGPFSLPAGKHSVHYRAKDKVGNFEKSRVTAVIVR